MRCLLYKLARLMGDANVLASGRPDKIVKRLVNKMVGRKVVSKLWVK